MSENSIENENSSYNSVIIPEPSREAVLDEYIRYKSHGGTEIKQFEVELGNYIEPPSLGERMIKASSIALRSLGFRA